MDHLLRKIERTVDFSKVKELTAGYYSDNKGRPAVDPVVLIKLALIQHLYGIRSLRQTVQLADENIAYRWFLGYKLSDKIPHFSTLSYAFSVRFPSELFENIFEWVLSEVNDKGLLSVETIYIDSTHMKASANRNKKYTKEEVKQTVRAYDEQLRREVNEIRSMEGNVPYEYEEDEESKKKVTKSKTDPDCGLSAKDKKNGEFVYGLHVACNDNNIVIGHVLEAGNVSDLRVFERIYNKAAQRHPQIKTVVVDAGYKSLELCRLVQESGRNISLPYKRPRKSEHFRVKEFVYDKVNRCFICPAGKCLFYVGVTKRGEYKFQSIKEDCDNCAIKSKCTAGARREICVHIWQKYMDKAEEFRLSVEGKAANRRRKETIERVFADGKEKHGMRNTALRGLKRVRDWLTMKFAVMNLKKLALCST
jgi:transposase